MAATIKQRIALDGGKELKRELEEFGAAGRKAFKELQDAAAQTKGLSPGFFNSLKQAEAQIKSLAQSFNEAGKAIQNVGRTLTTSLTLPIVGAGAVALKQAADFEKAMNSFAVNAAVAGTSFEEAEKKAQELGQASVFSSTEAAEGMTELAKVGLDFKTIMEGAADAMVNLAAANDTGLASSASVVGDVINQFKLSASQLPGIVDSITGATIESKLSFDDYRLAIGQAGGAAGALGVQFEEFNAVIAATASSFASGSDAGTSFKTFLTRLVPQSNQAAAMMEKLGLKFFDASGKMKSMSQIAQELQTKLGKLSQEDLNDAVSTIFGTDALRTAIALMRQGGKGIDDMMAKLKNTDSAEIAATRVKGLWGEIDQLKSALENLSIAIGKSGFLDLATNIVIHLTDWTQALATLNPEILKFGTIVAGLVASIGPLLLGLGLMTRAFGVTLQGVAALVGGFRLLSGALLFLGANPIIAALALVGTTIAIWATRADEATAALRVHEDLIGKVGNAYDQAGRKVGEMTQQLKDQALIAARQSQDVAQKALPDAIDEAINKIEQFDGLLPHAADGLFDLFKQFKDTKDIEAFREAVASIGAQSPELGNLAQQFLDITKPAHDLNVSLQESLNWIGLYTGKINDSEFAAKQAALGIAGWKEANTAAATSAKDLGTAVDETKTKVDGLSHTIQVFRGGGDKGITTETFNVIDGVAHRVEESKKALDDVSASAETAGSKVKAVADDIASHIRTVPDSLKTNSITPAVDGIITDVQRIKPAADEAALGLKAALAPTDDIGGGLGSAVTVAVDGVISDIQRLPGAASEAVGGLNSALAGIDTSGAQQAAAAVADPFKALPSLFSGIFSGLGSLIQGGFGNLTSVIRSLASQIRSEIGRILSALREAVAQAKALRAQASSSSSSGGGSQGGFAEGGHLSTGRGTSTSDSIPIWASLGEFITKAKAVAYYGPGLFHALNSMALPKDFWKSLRGFKIGGVVDGFNRSMSIPRMAGGGMVPALAASSPLSGKTVHVKLQYGVTEDQVIDMIGEESAVDKLYRFAIGESLTSAGRSPRRT
ncbi:MAG: phage tail tape measure protein [Mesorhizobium sp.]|uniref:phage tail tape measure protein n=1 Tax=Mesorhizobium sp. TaxID=1871066 RepID=UPI0011FCEA92|nr:phage tail tape measure protein [Mesorhizobium sp.]TIN36852.1 MAG: phage tail tape measure protein [Mesorhizobium sp.]TJU86697.1 MAG: phage tail tape measure protein [Mesorhizobium sp.]